VEVVQMHLPDRFSFFCSHNVNALNGGCYSSSLQRNNKLVPNCGTIRNESL
jgi:hypothetical protein